jgi:hypothetical protein
MNARNPSVVDAMSFDAGCPGGKAHYIVYFRQGRSGSPGDWTLERTSDGAIVDHGSLEAMLRHVGYDQYPHTRRATWAEDTLRFRPRVWDLTIGPPIHRNVSYRDVARKAIVP